MFQEAPAEIEGGKPSQSWPEEGKVLFDGYRTRYREGLDLVLRDINVKIEPAEKVSNLNRRLMFNPLYGLNIMHPTVKL